MTVKDLKADLDQKLGKRNYNNTERKAELVQLYDKVGILTKKVVMKGGTPSWIEKPRGMLQVAYERSLVYLERYNIEDFIKDRTESEEEKTSLQLLLDEYLKSMGKAVFKVVLVVFKRLSRPP